jgi:hypothetical protein
VLAQGLGVQAIRADAKAGTKCGPADNLATAVPAIETPANIKAAEIATREMNAGYLTVILEGKYTDAYLAAAGSDAPKFTDDDLRIISSPVDFIGINIYRPAVYVVASEHPGGFRPVPFNRSHPRMLSTWHLLGPEAMYWAPRLAHSLWKPDGQFRVERRLFQPVRPGLCRLQHAEANDKAQRRLFPRSHREKCGGLTRQAGTACAARRSRCPVHFDKRTGWARAERANFLSPIGFPNR